MLTEKNLRRFISIRNNSIFPSNLQFYYDAQDAGCDVTDLGPPTRIEDEHGNLIQWEWNVEPFGKLIEKNGRMRLEKARERAA